MDAPERKQVDALPVAYIHHEGPYDDIPGLFQRLVGWMVAKGLSFAGPAMGVYLTAPSATDVPSGEYEVCVPLSDDAAGEGDIQVKTLPACTVASIEVTGSYDQMTQRYTELFAWLAAEGASAAGPPRELYIRSPHDTSDPDELVTEIQIPIED